MKRKICFLLIGISLFILSISFVNLNGYYLILKNRENEIKIKINENDNFIISYKHSVALSKVYEFYKILNNKIILYEMDFSDQCAGLPTEVFGEEKFLMSDGKFKIINMNKEFNSINYRINDKYDFKLNIKDREFNLSEIFGTDLVIITLRRR
ncbi:MAG: DUF1850 domain-containing protein [Caldisericia bacterium]